MNNTEFKSLQISKEEIGAIQRYVSNAHISMNTILDIDPTLLGKLEDKGWYIDLSKEGIEKNIEYLAKLYSAMYKYSKKMQSTRGVLYRGTSIDEINKVKKGNVYDRFLSTATDKEVAMRFTEYKRGALITLSLDNDIPYIYTDEFLDETQVSETEVLISPFSKITNIEAYSVQEVEGVTRYSARLSKPQFENITDEKRKQYEEKIYTFDYQEKLKEHKELAWQLEIMENKIERLTKENTKDAKEEVGYILKQQMKVSDRLSKVTDEFKEIKHEMGLILQDKFKTIELAIDKSLEQDAIEYRNEQRKNKIESERNRKDRLMNIANSTLVKVEEVRLSYLTKDSDEEKLETKANALGIAVNEISSVDKDALAKFETLKTNMQNIQKEIESIEISDEMTEEEMAVSGKLNKKINNLYDKLRITTTVLEECEKTISVQKYRNKDVLSKNISSSVESLISAKAQEELLKQEQALMQKKDSLWDKITGRSKLKAAQIKNLKLRREFVQSGGLNVPQNVQDIELYLQKYSSIVGKETLPEPVKSLVSETTKQVEMTDEERLTFENVRADRELVPVKKSKKQMLYELEKKNEDIEAKIQGIDIKTQDGLETVLEHQTKNSVERCLDSAIFYTSNLTKEEQKKIMVDLITLK